MSGLQLEGENDRIKLVIVAGQLSLEFSDLIFKANLYPERSFRGQGVVLSFESSKAFFVVHFDFSGLMVLF